MDEKLTKAQRKFLADLDRLRTTSPLAPGFEPGILLGSEWKMADRLKARGLVHQPRKQVGLGWVWAITEAGLSALAATKKE